jgi:hypothetical protein
MKLSTPNNLSQVTYLICLNYLNSPLLSQVPQIPPPHSQQPNHQPVLVVELPGTHEISNNIKHINQRQISPHHNHERPKVHRQPQSTNANTKKKASTHK